VCGLSVCVCRALSDNRLSSVLDESSPLLIGLTSLSQLGLAANHIKSISRHAFDGLDSLRHLDLTQNEISSIQNNTFTQLNNLHTVSVSPSVCLSVSVVYFILYFAHFVAYSALKATQKQHTCKEYYRQLKGGVLPPLT